MITNFYNKKPKRTIISYSIITMKVISPNKMKPASTGLFGSTKLLPMLVFISEAHFLLRTASENFWCSMPLYEAPRRNYSQILCCRKQLWILRNLVLGLFSSIIRGSVNNLAHPSNYSFVAWNSLCSLHCST